MMETLITLLVGILIGHIFHERLNDLAGKFLPDDDDGPRPA